MSNDVVKFDVGRPHGFGRAVVDGDPKVVLRDRGDGATWVATVAGRSFEDLPELLEACSGDLSMVDAKRSVHIDESDLLVPVDRPRKIVCVGLNYVDHAEEAAAVAGEFPAFFPKWDGSLNAPFADIALPPESELPDYEAELAVIIGRRCRRIKEADVADVILGYGAANDGSIRDWQFHTSQSLAGKAWDGLTPIGPVIVPSRFLGGAEPDLELMGLLNGEVVQESRTSGMVHSISRIISYLSTFMALEPGDIVLTGTPSGVGFARAPRRMLKPGDVFEVRIEGIGSIRNTYSAESAGADAGRVGP